jgi:hypothetical protein
MIGFTLQDGYYYFSLVELSFHRGIRLYRSSTKEKLRLIYTNFRKTLFWCDIITFYQDMFLNPVKKESHNENNIYKIITEDQ